MKKLLTLLLAVASSVGTMFAWDYEKVQIGNLYYNLDATNQTAEVAENRNVSGEIIIPSSVTYNSVSYSVTSIGYAAFANCTGLTSVTIPNSVTSIGNYAFYYCTGLTSVTIPNSVTDIGYQAFQNCTSLTSVTIPNSVTSIGYAAFANCTGLTSVTISNSVTSIGGSVFAHCTGLTSVTIPNSVTSLGSYAFRDCTGLTSVTIPNSVTSIENNAFDGCTSLILKYIPNSVTSIGEGAFQYCTGLTSLTIFSSVTHIGSSAFRGCTGLNSITIPNSISKIEYCTFEGCTSLTSVTIPNSVTSIGTSAFRGCSGLTSVTIPNSVTSIEKYAFFDCTNLTSVTLNSNAVSKNCTADSSLKDIFGPQVSKYIIGSDVTNIGNWAFANCTGITSITIPNSVSSIGESAFNDCTNLTSVTLNSNAIVSKNYDIGSAIKYIFGSQVTEYILGNSVTSIGKYAFANCTDLNSITIPNSVTSIGNYAFYGCTGLTSVTIPNRVISIGVSAFNGCARLTSISLPTSITKIESSTFEGCSNLKSIEIPNSVTSIGYAAFLNCTRLTSITIPNSVTSIEEYTFKGCTNLTSVTIPNSVINIRKNAFYSCAGLASIEIPNSVASIEYSAFQYCTNLASIKIPNSVTSIGDWAFANCTNLKYVTISESVTSIGDAVFHYCTNLTSLVCYATTPPKLGDGVFYRVNCSNTPLYVPSESVELYRAAKQWKDFTNIIPISEPTLRFTISVTVNNSQYGIVEGAGTYPADTTITLTAIPNRGFQFNQWSDGNTDNPRTIRVIRDMDFEAYFEPSSCQISSGSCGEDLTWALSCDSLLIIEGSGGMANYSTSSSPWFSYYSYVKNVIIGNGVTSIGKYAFAGCTGLKSVDIPNSVTDIGYYAFNGCTGLTSVIIPDNVTNLGRNAFEGCTGLTSVVIGNSVKSIGHEAFSKCSSLAFVTIGNSVTSIGYYAFYRCFGLISVTVEPENPRYCDIDGVLFNKDKTSLIQYPTGRLTPNYAIPNSVTSIGSLAFWGGAGLTSITIPNSVTNIGQSAFSDCMGLTSITCEASTIPTLASSVFYNVDKTIPLYVPAESVQLYRTADQWKDFLNILPIPGTEIPCETYEFITDTMVYVGDEVMWHDGYVKAEKVGTYHYVDTLKTYLGCDSVFVLNLEVKPISQKMCSWLVESNDLEMGAIITNFTEPFYKYGTQITVEASPNSGYKFVKWNDGKKYNPYKFSLLDDKYLLAIFMEEQEEQDTTTVQPSSNSATFTWPFIVGGISYLLTIYLDVACTIPFCTITFNQYGQLIGITFGNRAPRRTMKQEDGFTYTVSGLDANTEYYFKMETMDEDNKLINTDEGAFRTTNEATGIENQYNTVIEHRKVMINGQIFILRGDKIYNAQGALVK